MDIEITYKLIKLWKTKNKLLNSEKKANCAHSNSIKDIADSFKLIA